MDRNHSQLQSFWHFCFLHALLMIILLADLLYYFSWVCSRLTTSFRHFCSFVASHFPAASSQHRYRLRQDASMLSTITRWRENMAPWCHQALVKVLCISLYDSNHDLIFVLAILPCGGESPFRPDLLTSRDISKDGAKSH
jgi:hypothetical protein